MCTSCNCISCWVSHLRVACHSAWFKLFFRMKYIFSHPLYSLSTALWVHWFPLSILCNHHELISESSQRGNAFEQGFCSSYSFPLCCPFQFLSFFNLSFYGVCAYVYFFFSYLSTGFPSLLSSSTIISTYFSYCFHLPLPGSGSLVLTLPSSIVLTLPSIIPPQFIWQWLLSVSLSSSVAVYFS